MRNRIGIVLFVITSSFLIHKKVNAQMTDSIFNTKKYCFFISPLLILDIINPAITIGYEHKFSKKFAIQIEGGPILKHSLWGYLFPEFKFDTRNAWWENKGGKLRVEFKYFSNFNTKKMFKRYHSCELFMTKNTSNVTQLFVVKDPTFDYSNEDVIFEGNRVYSDFYKFHRNRYGINFKIGIQELDKNNLLIDSFLGIGIVYQSAHETGRTNYEDWHYYSLWPFLNKGNRILPSITTGIKIGF
ncbi:MAG: hypothetical protein KA981_06295 [Bacteroidia bacterium]|jgi:hypothetical protein|nr:hypothetical protein [Bacteroidia bacterium]